MGISHTDARDEFIGREDERDITRDIQTETICIGPHVFARSTDRS
jgi:hypothetical protein